MSCSDVRCTHHSHRPPPPLLQIEPSPTSREIIEVISTTNDLLCHPKISHWDKKCVVYAWIMAQAEHGEHEHRVTIRLDPEQEASVLVNHESTVRWESYVKVGGDGSAQRTHREFPGKLCFVCLRPIARLRLCGACSLIPYCSRACQSADSHAHNPVCQQIKRSE